MGEMVIHDLWTLYHITNEKPIDLKIEKVTLFMTAEVVNDQSLLDILEISITDSENKQLYDGGYDEFEKTEIVLAKGESEKLTIKTTLPTSAGNEYQDKEANVKFHFEANGEEVIPEPIPEAPKTNLSRKH